MSTREIKFRAWSTEQNRFIGTEMIYFKTNGTINKRESTILMQFTGLRDKKGRDIYEGDIIKYDDGDGWEVGREEVKFENGAFNCACYHPDMEEFVNEPRIIEVIGNIYQTPDLIK